MILDTLRERRKKRQKRRAKTVRAVVRDGLLEWAYTMEDPVAAEAVIHVANSRGKLRLLISKAEDEGHQLEDDGRGRPILDAIALLFDSFRQNPEFWLGIIKMIVGIFTGLATAEPSQSINKTREGVQREHHPCVN